jgi:hypothetical protein
VSAKAMYKDDMQNGPVILYYDEGHFIVKKRMLTAGLMVLSKPIGPMVNYRLKFNLKWDRRDWV